MDIYSQIPLIQTLKGQRKCFFKRGVRIKRVGFRENVRALFPQGQSRLFVIIRGSY